MVDDVQRTLDTAEAAGRPAWWRRLLKSQSSAVRTQRELAAAVLDTVVAASVMVGASIHGTLLEILLDVLAALAIYWIAERYADLLASGVHAHRLTRARIGAELRHGWLMLEAALLPVVALLLVALPTGRVQAGVLADLAVATVLLGWLGVLAARRAGYHGWGAMLGWAGGSALLGGLIIFLKLSLH